MAEQRIIEFHITSGNISLACTKAIDVKQWSAIDDLPMSTKDFYRSAPTEHRYTRIQRDGNGRPPKFAYKRIYNGK
jgi:hypothetical protein